MTIELVTKADIQSIENKLQVILASIGNSIPAETKTVYNTKELAAKLKVSTKTINNWREQRLIEYCKVQGTILFTERAVTEFLASHSIKRRTSFSTSKTA